MMETAISCGHGRCGLPQNRHYWEIFPTLTFFSRPVPGAMQTQQRNRMLPPFILRRRRRRRVQNVSTTDFKACDCPLICYFTMAIALVIIGALTTVFVLDDVFGHFVGQLWLVGPLFIACGVVIFIRSAIFLRRRQMLQRERNQLRQRIRTLQQVGSVAGIDSLDTPSSRRDSFSSLPPDYEAVVNGVYPALVSRERHVYSARRPSRISRPSLAFLNLEEPPPAYEEIVKNPGVPSGTLSGENVISTIRAEVQRLANIPCTIPPVGEHVQQKHGLEAYP